MQVSRLGRKNVKVKALSTEEDLTTVTPCSECNEIEPYLVSVEVQGKQFELEVDTGAAAKIEAKLEINNTVSPRYYKARPVPLAMKASYEAEINQQVKMGVLKPVKMAE